MNDFLVYLLKASLLMAMLYIPYAIFWKNTTYFTLNRIYLLGSLVCSLIFPLLTITIGSETDVKTLSVLLDPITIGANNTITTEQSVPVFRILGTLYISGTFTFFILLLYRFVQVFILIKKEGIQHKNGFKTVKLKNSESPASFFKVIFIAGKDEHDEIYAHEKVHIQQGHSFDILFVALVKAVF